MTRRRCDFRPPPKFDFWKKEGKVYFADVAELKLEVERSKIPDEVMRKTMGAGYTHLEDALVGKPLGYWEVKHVEYGITAYVDPVTGRLIPNSK